MSNLVEIEQLGKTYAGGKRAVINFNLNIAEGEIVGLVGESGSGKTTLARTLLQLETPTTGKVSYDGLDIAHLSPYEMKDLRRKVQIVFQDPYSSLNPRMTVLDIVAEGLDIHDIVSGDARTSRVRQLLKMVGLPPDCLSRFPHEFSGGQRQRICIARALAPEPEFLVLDEPVSALDLSIQAQVVNLLKQLQKEMNLTYLFIAHDLALVHHFCDRVGVMYQGHLVELATAHDLFNNPKHPYTQALISAIPIPEPVAERQRKPILLDSESSATIGCAFSPRCPLTSTICHQWVPQLEEVSPGHLVACHVAKPIEFISSAPKPESVELTL